MSGKWMQLTGKAKETWGKVTDNDWTEIDGKREKLSGKLQERYGWAKDRAEQEVDDFVKMHDREPKNARPRADAPLAAPAAARAVDVDTHNARDLVRSGIKVLRYEPGMMHAKLALVDDDIVTGSANMDSRSFFLNCEVLLLVSDDAGLLAALEGWYLRMEARSLGGVRSYPVWRETLADLARLLSPMMQDGR